MKREVDKEREIVVLTQSGKVKRMNELKFQRKLKQNDIPSESLVLFPILDYDNGGWIPYVTGEDESILSDFHYCEIEYQAVIRYIEYDTNFGALFKLPKIEKECSSIIEMFNMIHNVELLSYFDDLQSGTNSELVMRAKSYFDVKLFNITIYDEDDMTLYRAKHQIKGKDMRNPLPEYMYCYSYIFQSLEDFYVGLTAYSSWDLKIFVIDMQSLKWEKLDEVTERFILKNSATHLLVGIYSEYSNTIYFITSESYRRFKLFNFIDVTYIRHYQHSRKFIKGDGDPYEMHHIGTQESMSIVFPDIYGQIDYLNSAKYIGLMMKLQMKYDPFFIHHEGPENAIPIIITYLSLHGDSRDALVNLNYYNDQYPTVKQVLLNAGAAAIADVGIRYNKHKKGENDK